MAIIPNDQEQSLKQNKKSRARRRRNRSNSTSSDTSSTSSSSSSSKKEAPPVSLQEQQMYVAMDCEMVGVGKKGTKSALARVTIVDWNCETIYDNFVQPTEPVTDYRTFVSGVTESDLQDAVIDLATCREQVLTIIQGKIVVGHALKNDLNALQITHPWQQTRDTAKYEPFMKVRFVADGILWPRKLSELCHEKLNLEIQLPGQSHSAYEDAVAALLLYKAVRPKWEKVMHYKIEKTAAIEQQSKMKQQRTTSKPATLKLLPIATAVA